MSRPFHLQIHYSLLFPLWLFGISMWIKNITHFGSLEKIFMSGSRGLGRKWAGKLDTGFRPSWHNLFTYLLRYRFWFVDYWQILSSFIFSIIFVILTSSWQLLDWNPLHYQNWNNKPAFYDFLILSQRQPELQIWTILTYWTGPLEEQ